jgi:hypothetical protein
VYLVGRHIYYTLSDFELIHARSHDTENKNDGR